jgi:hypothetical protein
MFTISYESYPSQWNARLLKTTQQQLLNIYSVTNQYLKKFSYGFWDNQWFGRNQIYLKLKLGALQFMPGIKNLNLIFF